MDFSEKERPVVGGVYFLFHEHALVYVGKSNDVYKRIAAHRSGGRLFDYAFVSSVPKSEIDWVEAALIRATSPPQNTALVPAPPPQKTPPPEEPALKREPLRVVYPLSPPAPPVQKPPVGDAWMKEMFGGCDGPFKPHAKISAARIAQSYGIAVKAFDEAWRDGAIVTHPIPATHKGEHRRIVLDRDIVAWCEGRMKNDIVAFRASMGG